MSGPPPIRLTIEPTPQAWRTLLRAHPPADPASTTFRRELSLDVQRPVILTGHQAAFWHPGILAKYMAAEIAADALDAGVGWVVVDQDEAEFQTVTAPVRTESGQLERRTIPLAPPPVPGAAACACACFQPLGVAPFARQAALESVATGLRSIEDALRRAGEAPNAARQVWRAVAELMSPYLIAQPTFYATEISRTELFRQIVERMRTDSGRMAAEYNDAVQRHPEAGIAPLRIEPGRVELPLWILEDGQPRRRAWSNDELEPSRLAPRALLMTGLLRMAGCELFIHGKGGGVYDRITEEWFREWLGRELAPTVVVSADVLLPLSGGTVTSGEVAAAWWRAHRARHDPALLGDDNAAQEKRSHLDAIEAARNEGASPVAPYLAMHESLERYRRRHEAGLVRLRQEAETLGQRLAEADIASDRTWAFPLHEPSALVALREELVNALALLRGGAAVSRPA